MMWDHAAAMLATQLNDLVTDNKITAQGIIRLVS